MVDALLTYCIGLLGGLAVGIQSPVAGLMGQRVGATASSFILHLGGTVISGLFLWVRGGEDIQQWRTLSWYMLASGGFGLLLLMTITHTLPRLGAGGAVILIIVGQLLMTMLIDHFGLFGTPVRQIDLMRVVAAVFLLIGAYLMVR